MLGSTIWWNSLLLVGVRVIYSQWTCIKLKRKSATYIIQVPLPWFHDHWKVFWQKCSFVYDLQKHGYCSQIYNNIFLNKLIKLKYLSVKIYVNKDKLSWTSDNLFQLLFYFLNFYLKFFQINGLNSLDLHFYHPLFTNSIGCINTWYISLSRFLLEI